MPLWKIAIDTSTMDPEFRALLDASIAAQDPEFRAVITPGTPQHAAWHESARREGLLLKLDLLTPGTPEHEAWFIRNGWTMDDFEDAFGPFTEDERAEALAIAAEQRGDSRAASDQPSA